MIWLLIKKAVGTVLFFFGSYMALIALFSHDPRVNSQLARLGLVVLAIALLISGVALWNAKAPVPSDSPQQNDDPPGTP